jgi:hypothetical protein
MKNYYFKTIAFFFFAVSFVACKNDLLTSEPGANAPSKIRVNAVQMYENDVITGFNQNWANLPQLNDATLIENINKLSPEMIRYPGGTVTHKWSWSAGGTGNSWDQEHPIEDVKTIVDQTGSNTKIMFVLDIVNSTLQNQLDMLDAAHLLGVPIEYIELGNELYTAGHDYDQTFATGADYATRAAQWATALKAIYPNAKIAALLYGREVNNPNDIRRGTWNSSIINYMNNNQVPIDAYTFHLYIQKATSAQYRIDDFEAAERQITINKEIWITEYGNLAPSDDLDYLTNLEFLTNYVESRFDIALNHAIIANNTEFSKLEPTSDGHDFTAEGNLFLTRADLRNSPIKVVINEIRNSQGTNGLNDAVELLVIRNHLDMKNMILKNFTGDGNVDGGAAYRFNDISFWSDIPKGAVIVIRNSNGTSSADVDVSNHTLDLNINDTNYFTRGSENPSAYFDVAHGIDMWMIKAQNGSGTTTNGVSGAIHTVFAGSSTSVLYGTVPGARLHSTLSFYSTQNNARSIYCKNTTSHIYDYKDEDVSQVDRTTTPTLGAGNTSENTTYINQLRNGW